MSARRYNSAGWWTVATALAIALAAGPARAQQAKPAGTAATPGDMVTLDRVAAIVNSDLILESDVEAEGRFAAFQPSEPKPTSRDELIERLIDRALIEQQMKLQPEPPVPDAEVDAELNTLRKAIPKCAAYHCETDAGWQKFVGDQGFTVAEVR